MTTDNEPTNEVKDEPIGQKPKFDPTPYMLNLKGKQYLPVAPRMYAFRLDHPDASVISEIVEITDKRAVFRATITIPGGGTAVEFGTETPEDFKDYVEKASTKALGRALAVMGYGTLSALDFEDVSNPDKPKVVDSPVQRSGTVPPLPPKPGVAAKPPVPPKPPVQPVAQKPPTQLPVKPQTTRTSAADELVIGKMTEEQRAPVIAHLIAKQTDAGWSEEDLITHIRTTYLTDASNEGLPLKDLILNATLSQCRKVFDDMQSAERAVKGAA